jgi:hypothetical protein
MLFVEDDGRCAIHGPKVEIAPGASCGFYLHGKPKPKGTATAKVVTPEESGLVDRPVRCENCLYFDGEPSRCGLYQKLNSEMPAYFDLEIDVDPAGCCNAQEPKKPKARRERRSRYGTKRVTET